MSQVKYSSSARCCFSSVKFAEGLVKMFCIWIIIRCYFAFLSIDIFVFFTRYSLRYLSLKLYISFIKFWLLYKVYGIRFRSEIICSS